jgi:hypothetical protein
MDSCTSSPTAALAAVSAALLTPTHRPPPATSIVLPVNGARVRWRVSVDKKATVKSTEMSRRRRESAGRPRSLVGCGEIFHCHPDSGLAQLAESEAVRRN